MVKEKKNLKGSKKLKKDLNDPEEKSDLNDTQENLNDDLNDLGEDENEKNPKKDLNDLGEEEDDSEKDHNDLEDDSEEDGLEDVMEKSIPWCYWCLGLCSAHRCQKLGLRRSGNWCAVA